jgi:hypothetical protein
MKFLRKYFEIAVDGAISILSILAIFTGDCNIALYDPNQFDPYSNLFLDQKLTTINANI